MQRRSNEEARNSDNIMVRTCLPPAGAWPYLPRELGLTYPVRELYSTKQRMWMTFPINNVHRLPHWGFF